jgi:hypothetical protein
MIRLSGLRNWKNQRRSRRLKDKLPSVNMWTPNFTPMAFAETAITPRVGANKRVAVSTQAENFTRAQFAKAVTSAFTTAETNPTKKNKSDRNRLNYKKRCLKKLPIPFLMI